MSETTPSSRSERVPFARPVHVTPLNSAEPPLRLVGGNLSRTGMFLRSPMLLPPGTKVSLAFEAKGQPLPFAEAEVVWQRAPTADGGTAGFALRFSRFLNPRGPELVEQLVSLGRTKMAEAEAKLAGQSRDASPALEAAMEPAEVEPAVEAARPPPAPADATPPGPLPAIPLSGRQPSFATGTGAASIGVPRPASLRPAVPEELPLGGGEVSHTTALRAAKLRGPGAGALALLVGVPLVIAVGAWRASTAREPALAVLEKKPSAPPAEAPSVAPAPAVETAPVGTAPVGTAPGDAAPTQAAAEKATPPLPEPTPLPAAAAPAPAPLPEPRAEVKPAAAEPVAAAAPEPAKAAPAPKVAEARAEPRAKEQPKERPEPQGKGVALKLGTGPLSHLQLRGTAQKLELDLELPRGAHVTRAFALKGPNRLVVDVAGGAQGKAAEQAVAHVPGVQRARVGPQAGGATRLVLDLSRPAGKVGHAGDRVTLSW